MEQTPTFESVWALLQENAQQLKESRAAFEKELKESREKFEKELKESRAEFDRRMKESEQKREEARAKREKEMEEAQAKREKAMEEARAKREKEREEARAKREKEMEEAQAKRKKEMEAARILHEKEMKASERRIKKIEELTGSWAHNQGAFAEEYFFTAFEEGQQNFFGEKFDDIAKNISNKWQGIKDEYDIVLYNHTSVALIEVKFKAHLNDIPNVIKKAETFRFLFPGYKDFRIYLGLASLSFYAELEQECINQGIAIIKQVGSKVIINDAHLKVF